MRCARTLLHAMVTAIALAWVVGWAGAETAGGKPPNIVMIISDDHTYRDFGFMDNGLVKTPHLDRLAAMSARYVSGYVTSPVCRPSLATLLTGLHTHQHRIHFNHPPPADHKIRYSMSRDEYYAARARCEVFIRAVPALPRILARHGYDCLQTGKFWEGHHKNAGFTHGMTTGRAAGVDGCSDKQLSDGSTVALGNGDIGLTIGRSTMQPLYEFIDAHDSDDDRPFFIWFAPFMPHAPHNPPQEYLDLYEDDPAVPRHYVEYYASCTWFDDTVGALLAYLEKAGLTERTIFAFVADNGWTPATQKQAGGPGYTYDRRSKRSPFEAGSRTPILIGWKGHVQPATHRAPCSSIDIVPTILHAVGLGDQAQGMPGINLMPSALGNRQLEQRPVFGGVYPGGASSLGNPSGHIAYRWVRDGPWKLIVPHRHGDEEVYRGYLEQVSLFDVERDPDETTDLSGDPQYADRLKRLRRLLDDWWTPDDQQAE